MLILGARKQVRHVVDEETYSKYEEFTLASALNAMPDIRWCPKPDCKNAMVRTYRPIPCVASCAPIRSSKSTLVCITACSDRRRGQPHDGVFQFGVPLQLLLQVQGGVACRYVRGVWRGVALYWVSLCCTPSLVQMPRASSTSSGEGRTRRPTPSACCPVPGRTIDLFTQLTHSRACGRARLTKVR